ncbi:DNA polymerase III subunit alpha [Candidatus Uhrbacteria bacterium]|nr:DNA polymerase III subunit alpha [Candidatus Uhrbacteria bacterium]
MKFVHLHNHSHYSLLDGLGKIPELVNRAKELGMEALAITDHGNMYGAIEFYEECVKAGIKPIIGMETYVAPNKMGDKRPKIDDHNSHLILLARNLAGYKNLMFLSSKAHLEGFYYKPRVDKELLRARHEGLIALSGCLNSEVSKAIQSNDLERAERLALEYRDIFGPDNFYLEVQDHPEMPLQMSVNEEIFKLSLRAGIPVAATKDCHYIRKEDAEAQDLMLCIQMGKTVDDPTRMSMRDCDYSLASGEEMAAAFIAHPEAVENTWKIAEKCDLKLELNKWNFPVFPELEGRDADSYLRESALRGLASKFGELNQEILSRLDYELDIIAKKGYATYFLVVADYVNWARSRGIIATTRGSAAGSLVSFAIGIITINPLDYKLPFERFLNPYRPSPPDIDVDFADNRRDEVLEYVTARYGADKVAQICTFGTMAARGSVRDVARALGYPYGFGDRVAKLIPFGSQGFPMTLERALVESPELAEAYKEPDVKRVIDLARKMEGCARHTSVHAAGVVIGSRALTEFTPLQKETGGEKIITQYEMNAVEKAGVLKMDFLGIRNLSILGQAVDLVKKTKNVEVNLLNLPLDDQKTFELLAAGDTIGLFQLNGSGMTRYLRELKPSSIFDIMAMVALYRPGPIESIPEYVRRKHNPALVKYLDPRMKDILQTSYGIITYQDDVLLISIHLAGYSWEEADKLRKAIGKKIPEEMAKQKEKFISGCVKNGMEEIPARELWALIEPFAAYGFNKAHAASYAMVAYQTAYMKANFPAEYMTAVMTAEEGDLEKIAEAVAECKRMRIEVLPPSINESNGNFTYIDDRHIRFGLLAIKNLGADVTDAIIAERRKNGIFASLSDFASRLSVKYFNKRSLEALIKSGAMDSLDERNAMLSNLPEIQNFNKDIQSSSLAGQGNLFAASDSTVGLLKLKHIPPAGKAEMLSWEKELLGLYVTEHPFTDYAAALDGHAEKIQNLKSLPKGYGCNLGGIVASAKKILTKKNETMLFAKIEDETGTIEAIVFPRVYAEEPQLWKEGEPLFLAGKISEKEEELRFIVERAQTLANRKLADWRQTASPAAPAAIMVKIEEMADPHFFEDLRRVLIRYPGERRVVLFLPEGEETRKIETDFRVADSDELRLAIEQLAGSGSILAAN